MRVYIIRHGETEYNRRGILQGNINSPLLEESIDKAKELNKWASSINFDMVMSSNLNRAFDTAKIIIDNKYDISKNKDISEMTFGYWQGKTKEEIFQSEPDKEQYHNYFFAPNNYKNINGGESFSDIVERANNFIETLKNMEKDGKKDILVVTHGAFIKAVAMVVKENPIEKFWEEPFVYNLSLTLLEVVNGKVNLLMESDLDYYK